LVTTLPASEPNRARLAFEDQTALQQVLGESNRGVKVLEREVGASLHVRGNEVAIEGDQPAVELGCAALTQLYELARRGHALVGDDPIRAVRALRADRSANLREIFADIILVPRSSRPIGPRGLAQKRYVDAVRRHDIVFGIGPAGTGKTYLAMAMAVRALLDKRIKRIVLTRPAVEAGEKLGFLPGTLEEKVNPYLRPLYDAMHEMLDFERVGRFTERGIIEVAPLAFMRGRTLNDSFVILDEAQNATSEQMRMFLTRLGFGSKAVVTGDVTQSDLPSGARSGLREARDLFKGVEGISLCYFSEADVVRHPLVQKIIIAYERRDAERRERERRRDQGADDFDDAGGHDRAPGPRADDTTRGVDASVRSGPRRAPPAEDTPTSAGDDGSGEPAQAGAATDTPSSARAARTRPAPRRDRKRRGPARGASRKRSRERGRGGASGSRADEPDAPPDEK
jgi:phosphate starvation-inducible PhoH-like protein